MTTGLSDSTSSPLTRESKGRTPREVALTRPLPERVSWDELGTDFLEAWGHPGDRWQPEHVAIVGPTGSGKSFFEKTILIERARMRGSHVVVIATKPADSTLTSMGWPIVTSWPPSKGWRDRKKTAQVIYWAKAKGIGREGRRQQAIAVQDILAKLWKPQSNIIVAFDEIAYIQHELGLRTTLETYYREARALGITIVASTQRPQGVTRYMHSESTWSVFFAPKDEEDAERMAQTAGNKLYYRRVLAELRRDKHEFLLVHNLTNESFVSSIPRTSGVDTRPRSEPKQQVDKTV